MIVVEVCRDLTAPGFRIELPGVPRLGDVIMLNTDWDGTVEEVVWEPGQPPKIRIG